MSKTPLFLIEIIWILIGLASSYISVKEFINSNSRQALMFLGMAVISFLLAWFRDRQRKKM